MFDDRRDAGRRLAARVDELELHQPYVLGLPRGGMPVAFEIAQRLGAPLDVFVVRKLGAPGQPELGVGALAEGGTTVIDEATCRALAITPADLDDLATVERHELDRRVARYRKGRALPPFTKRDVVVVDDGLATGVTARAALQALRDRAAAPARLVLAAPVAAAGTADRLTDAGIEVVTLSRPATFVSVGSFYARFDQTTDDEVVSLLDEARASAASTDPG